MKNPRRCALPLIGLLLVGAPLCTRAAEFNQVQTGKGALAFAYKQMGVPMEGRFHKFAARIAFDPSNTGIARAQIEVDLASIDTGFGEADSEVLGRQWFDTGVYPVAQFVSTGVRALGGNRYEALGRFTLKGRSRDISAPFIFRQEGAVGLFDGTLTLKRLDYGIGEGAWADTSAVSDEIQVKFHIVAGAAPTKK